MRPPDRFYYNLGEFFREMEPMEPDGDYYFSLGVIVGNFFKGIHSAVDDEVIALELTTEFINSISSDGPEGGDGLGE